MIACWAAQAIARGPKGVSFGRGRILSGWVGRRRSASDEVRDAFEFFEGLVFDDELAAFGAFDFDDDGGSEAGVELFFELEDVWSAAGEVVGVVLTDSGA